MITATSIGITALCMFNHAGPTIDTPDRVLASTWQMLEYLAHRMPAPEIVVLLSADVMAAQAMVQTADGVHPEADDLAAAGWKHSQLGAWVSYTLGDRYVIHVAYLPWCDPERSPIIAGAIRGTWRDLPSALDALDIWCDRMGTPYRGTPGMAGHAVLRHHHRTPPTTGGGRRANPPVWRPDLVPSAEQLPARLTSNPPIETAYTKRWKPACPVPTGPTVTIDCTAQYLAAAAGVDVAPGALRRNVFRGGLSSSARDRSLAGYWRVELPAWDAATWQLPNPAGEQAQPGACWLTSPTLDLLDELTRTGHYPGYLINESWTAPGSRRVLRTWAETIRDTIAEARFLGHDDGYLRALKGAYTESIGLFNRAGGRVYRPDWQASIIARARCVQWRKMRKALELHGARPLALNVDAITYAGTTPPPNYQITAGTEWQIGAYRIISGGQS